MRMRRNKVASAASEAKKDIKKAAKKKGFISRTISSTLMLGLVGAGVKYFTDATAGAARRQKVLSLVGKS
jgi:F0F1-type ATP synthase assembly protein I